MELTSGQKAVRTRRLREAGRKAATTRRRRAAGKNAAKTRIRRAAARKAVATRKRSAARRTTSSAESEGESGLTNWGWREGVVDIQGEHIELRYGDAEKSDYEQWLPIALIGKPTSHVFPVRWLLSAAVNPEILSEVQRELDFYLVEHPKGFPGTGHPWDYAIYHCNTSANMYSSVHWSYFPNGNREQRHSSSVIRLSDGSKAIFKPAR